MRWTKPHFGVSHLEVPPKGFQVTIADYGSFCNAFVLALYSASPFTPFREKDFIGEDRVERAKRWLEEVARGLGNEIIEHARTCPAAKEKT